MASIKQNRRINKKESKIIPLIKLLLNIAIIGMLAFYLCEHLDIFLKTLEVSWLHIFGLIVCIFITWGLNCYQLVVVFRLVSVKIGFWENMFVFIATLLVNHLPMRVGTILRMHYFKKIHGVDYAMFGGLSSARMIMVISSTGLLGCIGLIGLRQTSMRFDQTLFLIFLAMMVIPIGIYLIPMHKLEKKKVPQSLFVKIWYSFMAGFGVIKSSPNVLWQILLLIILQFLILAIRLYITFDAIQLHISPWVLLILAPVTALISFISLTPGNLGLREWVIGSTSFLLGIDFQNGVFAGTIDRAALLGCTFFFGIISLFFVKYRLERKY